ncbi:MAG: hypothetical protein RL708_1430 [Bacteroidota bacterium]
MNKIILVLSFLFIVFSNSIFAQKQHGVLLKTDSSIISSHGFASPERLIYLDTTLNNFHQFHPAYQQFKTPFYFDIGNLGQPIYTYNQKLNTPFGFNFQKPEYEALRFDMNQMQLYNTYNKVYSELYYTMALKSESMLDAHHSQRLTKNISFDGRYRYINADGIYLNQATKIHNLFLNTSIVSNNERYHSQIGFLVNRISFQENGGTTMDSVYEQSYINKNVVPTVLTSESSKVKEDTWQLNNSYDFGKKWTKKISDTLTLHHYVPFYRLQHSVKFDNHYRTSKDGNFDSLHYNALPFSTMGDTFNYQMVVHTISNNFTFSILGNSKILNDSIILQRPFVFDISAEHQIIKVKNYNYNLDTSNINFHASLRSNYALCKHKLSGEATLDYSATGYNKGNYKFLGFVSYNFLPKNIFYALAVSQNFTANYSTMNFSSRYFSVVNVLPSTHHQQMKIGYKQLKYKFSIEYSYSVWDKYNYITNGFNAATINNATVSIITFEKDFAFKKFHFNNILQVNNQNQTKTIFPKWMYSGQVYYQNFVFKKAMFMQIGLQLNSYEKYYAPYFMPVADNFYYQNQTNFSQQHQLQFFINAKIKKVRIFIKADNLLQGLDGHGTYVSKYYPLPDRTVKFGISWRFFD